jgi:N-acetylglucosamine-6-phosphate deacetylase
MELRAIHYATEKPISIEIESGLIRSIAPLELTEADQIPLPTAAPGVVDLQINGYGGLDINASPLDEQTPGEMVRAIWREGVTTCFPTVITNYTQAIAAAMKTLARACDTDAVASAGIGGIHLEGPFISSEDGPRGAHAREHVQPPDWDLFQSWQEAAGGRIRLITLSPEWPGSNEFISRCVQAGVTVSIGHTAATSEQIAGAVRAGARMSTHLGNAAHLMLPRHPNYLWEQLAQDDLWTSVIADGFHLPDQVLKVILKVKGPRAILISDAVSLAGMRPGIYATPVGGRVVLTREGRLHLAENEKLLAGSVQMLVHGIEHLERNGLATLAEAWEMASVRPANFMKLSTAAGLTPGAPADLVLFHRWQERIELAVTYKAGQLVHAR